MHTLLRQTIDETFRVLFICLSVNIYYCILYKAINNVKDSMFVSRYSHCTLQTDDITFIVCILYYLETKINQVGSIQPSI